MRPVSIEAEIARLKSLLSIIPTATLRQIQIIRFLNRWTRSDYCSITLTDDLGRYVGGLMWPVRPDRLLQMARLGPTFVALSPVSDLFENIWDSSVHRSFQMLDSLYLKSLLYRYVFRSLDQRHIAVFGYPVNPDGTQPVIFACRRHRHPEPYQAADFRILDRICSEFAEELSCIGPAGPYLPRLPTPGEHVTELDKDYRPKEMPLFAQALLELFYGPSRNSPGPGVPPLPTALEQDIRAYREDHLKSAFATESGFFHTFTKAHRGRVLCVTVHSDADGAMKLSVHEDLSRHKRLSRIKAACRELTRDRSRIFSTCLLLEEGVVSTEEIARRAGFAALKPTSAHQIVKQARRVLAELASL